MNSNITAIIPVYNGRRYLREAIASVTEQTLRPDHLIIIDDGSTDGSSDCVQDMSLPIPLTLIKQANRGQAAARNKGISLAKTELVALLDQDDVWYPQHCERLAQPLLASESMGWSYSNCDSVDQDGNIILSRMLEASPITHPKRDLKTCLSEDMFILPSASLIRKKAIDAVGGFDEQLVGYEDDDLFLRLLMAGWDNTYFRESLSFWRMHAANTIVSPRMISSRRHYATKLMSTYPDQPERNEYYVRDCIAPRFYALTMSQYEWGLVNGKRDLCHEMLVDMRQFAILAKRGIGTKFFLSLLKHPRLAWLALRANNTFAACRRKLSRLRHGMTSRRTQLSHTMG